MSKSITEPHPDKQSTEIKLPNTENFRFFIKDGQLHLQNIPEAGYIKVFNMMGHCMFQKRIRQGSLECTFYKYIPPTIKNTIKWSFHKYDKSEM